MENCAEPALLKPADLDLQRGYIRVQQDKVYICFCINVLSVVPIASGEGIHSF